EDSPESLRLIESYLKALSLECHCVSDGQALLALARQHTFDLLIVDIGLPMLDGLEVVKTLRAEGVSCPIISISANCAPQDLERYSAAGFTETVGKPFKRQQFIETVARLISSAEGQQDLDAEHEAGWGALADQFAEGLPQKVAELFEVLEKQDFARLIFLVHRIRAAGMFGFDEVSKLCAQLEAALSARDVSRVEVLLHELSASVDKIQQPKNAH
ncbi:MAG: response regulator, partial [Deltaproteobacteria bacterium]|nr:response regulator [Deltaproteobacteria bacterium]